MLEPICRRLIRMFSLPCCRFRITRRNPKLFLTVVAFLLLVLLLTTHRWQGHYKVHSMEIRLPQAALSGQSPGAYLCTSVSLQDPKNASAISPIYIVEFEPLVPKLPNSKDIVHHMLLAECSELPEGVAADGLGWWNCGFEQQTGDVKDDKIVDVSRKSSKEMCYGRPRYLFAYSSHAPVFRLPSGVAMPAGDGQYYGGAHLVLQIHSSSNNQQIHRSDPDSPVKQPEPGLRLHYLDSMHSHYQVAGVHLSAATGRPASSRLITGCEYTGDLSLRPFALRVHTHSLGRLVSVYRVRRPQLPQQPMMWHLIGQADPRQPHAYYPTNASDLTVKPGDLIATVCAMDSKKDRAGNGGSAPAEMCNAWLTYRLEEQDTLSKPSGPAGSEGKVDLHHVCGGGHDASRLWSDVPSWVVKQAFLAVGP